MQIGEHQAAPAWQPHEALSDLAEAGFRDAVAELIDDYISDTAARLDRLRAAMRQGDDAAAKKEAHSIKGSSLQMGAAEAASYALLIEKGESRDVEMLATALQETWLGMGAYLGR